jgi:amino acid transporter
VTQTLHQRVERQSLLKRILLGRPLASEEAGHQLLRKLLALPVFSSDALSSVAYATEEIMLVLVLAGTSALRLVSPLSAAIGALLLIVVASYRQTVRAYPSGGGAYIVSHENLGEMPGLIAAGALLTDYVLTVSVSVAAGVAAITSAAPGLVSARVPLALVIVVFITIMNLRGVKESGTLFAIPTYGFIVSVYLMIGVGFAKCLGGCPHAASSSLKIPAAHLGGITFFLVLRAFSSGSTALTGVEAISNGVPAFRRPQARNAASTLGIMGAIAITMFLGISFLAHSVGVRQVSEETVKHLHPGMPVESVCDRFGGSDPVVGHFCEQKTVVAQIAETVFGHGFMFFIIQTMTALILILAANTSYQDFPRLSSILARDRYMPRQFMNRGDRLVFSNGVVVLAALSSLLIWIFNADVTRLIQLYVVGVFTSFTLSQSGMVRHWIRTRERGWKRSAVINGIGAFATGLVLIVVTMTKFKHGAYIVVIAIPIIVMMFKGINRHYGSVAGQLRAESSRPRQRAGTRAVVLVRRVDDAAMRALGYAIALRPMELRALFVGEDDAASEVRAEWDRRRLRVPLDVVTGKGDFVDAVRSYVRGIEREGEEYVTIVVPESLRRRGIGGFLGQRRTLMLKAAMLFEPQVVLSDVPSHDAIEKASAPVIPARNVAVVLVSGVHNATLRALFYARALSPSETRAVTFNVDESSTQTVMEDWADAGTDVPLEVIDSPYREVTRPLIRLIRQIRATTPGVVVTVIVPEFVVSKWWHQFLHNQTALAIKASLLFEPGVVLTSVPYHLS